MQWSDALLRVHFPLKTFRWRPIMHICLLHMRLLSSRKAGGTPDVLTNINLGGKDVICVARSSVGEA